MAKKVKAKKGKAMSKKVDQGQTCFAFALAGWLLRGTTSKRQQTKAGHQATLLYVASGADAEKALRTTGVQIQPWQIEQMKAQAKIKEVFYFATPEGPLWLLKPLGVAQTSHHGHLQPAPFTKARDLCGMIFLNEEFRMATHLHVKFFEVSDDERLGALCGLEVGSYSAKNPNGEKLPLFVEEGHSPELIKRASELGRSQNLARHLTNIPANLLNPKSYAQAIVDLLDGQEDITVDVWEDEKLVSEKLTLLLAVGQGAEEGPRLVHIKYRAGGKKAPFAVVGKGITFDSGGLDIKPPAGMRWMKKDMAGSAALVGFAYWLSQTRPAINCDIYLALAENAISSKSFRPGDVIRSRNGLSVEIHNTDAEGRLVLADALDVAIKQEGADAPDCILNFATLTGAMRVSVGTELYGLFSNADELAERVMAGGRSLGDRGWRQPLVKEYDSELKSTVADVANASPSGFGGAITAALFLERFVGGKPWAHLDMYGWTDRPTGCFTEAGGNGQGVMTLIAFAKNRLT